MRMWNVDPRILCRVHLLGEHVEMHMFLGAYRKNTNLSGYLRKGLVELHNIKERHDALAFEMLRRGYKHDSPMLKVDIQVAGRVDLAKSYKELNARCEHCRARMNKVLEANGDWSKVNV